MIQFNELRITPDAKYLIIDVSIKDDVYFNDYQITNIVIEKISSAESLNGETIFTKEITVEDITVYINGGSTVLVNENETVYIENGVRKLRLLLPSEDLNYTKLRNGIFKVIIDCDKEEEGVPYPEGYANSSVTALVIDLHPFYINTMKYFKCFNECSENKDLMNAILRFKALELSVKTGNIDSAIAYWFKYFASDKVLPNPKYYG